MPIPAPNRFTAPTRLTARNDVYPFIAASTFRDKLQGKTIAITGASSGIGRAAALAFAAAGANIACIARNTAELDAVVQEIRQAHADMGLKAIAVTGDVARREEHSRIVAEVVAGLGEIDVLLNCAGVTRFGPFAHEGDMGGWWRVMEVNLLGTAGMVHAVLPSMLRRRSGTIINVASTAGSLDIPFALAYAASKAGVIKFSQALHDEVGNKGVNVFSVHPGTIQTNLASSVGALNLSEEALAEFPEMGLLFEEFKGQQMQTLELAAHTFVTLAANEDAALLSGLYVDAQSDLGEMIAEARKEGKGSIGEGNLYKLKLEQI